MSEISLILADGSFGYLRDMETEMLKGGLDVIAQTDDGEELFSLIEQHRPKSVVMDIILKNLDGIEVLTRLRERRVFAEGEYPVIIINSSLDTQAVVDKAIELGAMYYFRKPTLHAELARRIKMLCNESHELPMEYNLDANPAKREQEIAMLLKKVGVPAHLIGYKYLLSAIMKVCEDLGAIDEITNNIYPSVAAIYDTTAVRVERSIRYAIEAAFDKGYGEEVEKIFGYTVDSLKGKPTNSEFIAMVADNIMMR